MPRMNAVCWKQPLAVGMASLMLSLSGYAAAAAAAPSGLAAAFEQAWRLHPQAASLDAREAEARAAQDLAGGLTPEPGSISIGSRNDRLNRNRGKQEYEVELATPLWLPGQKAAREAEAASLIDAVAARAPRCAWNWPASCAMPGGRWLLHAMPERWRCARLQTRRARWQATSVVATRSASCRASTPTWRKRKCTRAESDLIETEATLLQAEQALRTLTGVAAPADIGEESGSDAA